MAGFSVVANLLFALTNKDMEFIWSPACEEALHKLKGLLIEAPVLAFPEFDRGFLLDTDASGVGLGAVLAQKQNDGSVSPVAYASRTLQLHEQNYGVTELEALGVVWAVWHFRHYLYGHHCDVFTDHEALKSLLNTLHPSGKLASLALALQEVDLSIFYRPGKKNVLADARSPLCEKESPVLVQKETLVTALESTQDPAKSRECNLGERQRGDPWLQQVIAYLETGALPTDESKARELAVSGQQYVLLEGVLYHVERDKTLRVIPPECDRRPLFDDGAFSGHLRDAKFMENCQRDIGGQRCEVI